MQSDSSKNYCQRINPWLFRSASLFFLLFFLLTTAACSKLERTERRLEGSWEIVHHQFIDPNGFSTYPTTVGTIQFASREDVMDYNEQYDATDQGVTASIVQSGIITFNDDSGESFTLAYNETGAVHQDCKILLLTKDDLKFEIPTPQGKHIFILKND